MVVVVKSRHRKNGLLRLSRGLPLRLHSLCQKVAGHLMNPTDLENPYLNFLRFKQKRRKSKVHDLYVNESQGSGSIEAGLPHFLYA